MTTGFKRCSLLLLAAFYSFIKCKIFSLKNASLFNWQKKSCPSFHEYHSLLSSAFHQDLSAYLEKGQVIRSITQSGSCPNLNNPMVLVVVKTWHLFPCLTSTTHFSQDLLPRAGVFLKNQHQKICNCSSGSRNKQWELTWLRVLYYSTS